MADEQTNPFSGLPRSSQEPRPSNPFSGLPASEDGFWERVGGRVADTFDLVREGIGLAVAPSRTPSRTETVSDIGKGIQYGVASTAQGLAELPATGFDIAFGTNTVRGVDAVFAPLREQIRPETTAGNVAADLTAFGAAFVPFAGWLSRAGQVARGTRAATTAARGGMLSNFMRSADQFGRSAAGRRLLGTKLGQYGTTALATGAFTSIVSPDGRATLSDSFDALPDVLKTEEDTNLTGRAEGLRRIRNRLRSGVEDTIMSGAFDTALGAFGAGARQVARVPQVAAAANAFLDGLSATGETLARRMPKSVAFAKEWFTPTGGADRLLYEEAEAAKSQIRAAMTEGTKAADDYTSALNEVLETADLETKSRLQSRQFEGEVTRYLEGLSDTLPSIENAAQRKKITSALDKMIEAENRHIDKLMAQMEAIAKDPRLDGEMKQRIAMEAFEVLSQTRKGKGTHLRRTFQRYTDPVKFYQGLDLSTPFAKEVQQEVAANIAAASGRKGTDEAVQLEAKEVILKSLGLGTLASTRGIPEAKLIEQAREAAIKASSGKINFATLRAQTRPEFVTDQTLFTPQEEMLSKSPKLRQLLGETTNPIERYVRSLEDVVRSTTAQDFYDSLPTLGVVDDLFSAAEKVRSGARPSVVKVPDLRSMTNEEYFTLKNRYAQLKMDPTLNPSRTDVEDLINQDIALLQKEGYIQLGEPSAVDAFGGKYGSLSGSFVSPETYRAITQPLRFAEGWASEALAIFSNIRNFTQKMTIVPNPAAQVRNVLGNTGFLAGNANLPNGGDFTDLLYTFVSSLAEVEEAGLSRLARKLQVAGLAESNLVIQALKTYQNAAKDLTAAGKMNDILNKAEGFIPLMKQFEAVYGDTDTLFKGLALLAEEGKYANAFSRVEGLQESNPYLIASLVDNGLMVQASSQMAKELTPLELMAAEIVRDTMPVYQRVVRAVKALDAVPFVGNFTSFAAENIRNSIGTVMRGVREAAFEAGPDLRLAIGDQAADALEREIRAIGVQRLMAYTTMAYVLPKTMVKVSMQATGTTPEQMDSLYEMNPPYLDGHDLVVVQNDKENLIIDYVDLSYVMPYAFMTDPAQAAIRQIQENGRADKNMVASVLDGVFQGISKFADPFVSEALAYERLRDVLPSNTIIGRGGVTATGAPIWQEGESPAQIGLKSFYHLIFGFMPNYSQMILEERSGKLRQGRLLRAYTGVPDAQGQTTDPATELARLVTGFTPMRLDMRTDARYSGSEYLPLRSDARSRMNAAMRDAAATPSSISRQFDLYLDDLYRAQSALYRRVEAMRTLGMSESDIRYALINQAGLGAAEANGIIDGRFSPGLPSEEVAADIQDQVNREGRTRLYSDIFFDELDRKVMDRVDQPLRTAPEGGEPVREPARNPFQGLPQSGSRQNPFQGLPRSPVGPQGSVVPAPAPSPVMPAPMQTAAAQVPLSPAILGDNPFAQAANAEIAARTGRA